jgi:hypothetical protein
MYSILLCCLLIASTGAQTFEFDASSFTSGDSHWNDLSGAATPLERRFVVGSSLTSVVPLTTGFSCPTFDAAVSFPGGTNNEICGLGMQEAATTTLASFALGGASSPGLPDWSSTDVTIDMWFRPANLAPALSTDRDGYPLWETGGFLGCGLYLADSVLYYKFSTNGAGSVELTISYDLGMDLQSLVCGDFSSSGLYEYINAVVTIDTATLRHTLYVNGESVGDFVAPQVKWTGGNVAGLGFVAPGGTGAGGFSPSRPDGVGEHECFQGEIASFKGEQTVKTAAQVLEAYMAFFPIIPSE